MTHLRHIGPQLIHLVRGPFDEHLPAATGFLGHPLHPVGVQLVAAIGVDEFLAVDARLIGKLHHRRVDLHDAAVDAVKLVDQRFDTVVVQVQVVDQSHDLGADALVFFLIGLRKGAVLVQGGRNPAVLNLAQLDVVIGNDVERFQHLRLQRGFHCGQRHVGLFVVILVVVIVRDRVSVGVNFACAFGGLCLGACGWHDRSRFFFVAHLGAECRLKVDDIAQQNVFGQKFVAPDRDRLEGQRAFTQPRDHRVAPCLDPLGDGNLALAAQQFNRSHLAQIHANGVIRAVQFFGRARGQRHITVAFRGRNFGPALGVFFFGFFVFDHVDAHFGQHRHHILDLLRADLVRGQNGVQLIVGDIALFTGFADHLFDGGLAHIKRMAGILVVRLRVFVRVFGGHEISSSEWVRIT